MTQHSIFPREDSRRDGLEGGICAFYRVGSHGVGGWVRDPARPERRFVVEIRVDGEVAALTLAESFVPELRERFGGDGCHGFVVMLDPVQIAEAGRLEAFVANTEFRLGGIDRHPNLSEAPLSSGRIAGELRWAGGLRLSGWACDIAAPSRPQAVEIMVDGESLVEIQPTRWREAQRGDVAPSGRFAFDACLPARLADGKAHTVRALAGGADLAGSPTLVLVHELGYAGLAGELDPQDRTGLSLRAQLLDRLMPSSIPLGEFEAWRARFPVDVPPASDMRVAVLVLGDGQEALARTVASLEAQSHPDWSAVCLPGADGRFRGEDFAAAVAEIAAGGAGAVLVVEAGAELDGFAVAHLAAALADPVAPGLVYSDSVAVLAGGRRVPSFKPGYDPHRMLAQAYATDCFAMTPGVLSHAASARPDNIYGLLFAALRRCEEAGEPVGHVPQLLVTIPERDAVARAGDLACAAAAASAGQGIARLAEPLASRLHPTVALAWPRDMRPEPVSIIIPTRDRADLLGPCIESLLERTEGVDYEVIVVDNGSCQPATHALFDKVRGRGGRVLAADFPFNYPRLNNLAVAEARHGLVCLLNNDTEVIEGAWLREMALEMTDPRVGIVGATLLWPSRLVQHGGVVLGPHFAAGHAFNDHIDGEPGYDEQLLVPRAQSAVTAACLLLRKDNYLAVGGMDEQAFPVAFNDVDLCLKVRDLGKTVMVTPRARLLHKESASRGRDVELDKRARARKELAALRERWAHVLAADPFYNPNLCLDLYPFSGLATPPRRRQPRFDVPQKV